MYVEERVEECYESRDYKVQDVTESVIRRRDWCGLEDKKIGQIQVSAEEYHGIVKDDGWGEGNTVKKFTKFAKNVADWCLGEQLKTKIEG